MYRKLTSLLLAGALSFSCTACAAAAGAAGEAVTDANPSAETKILLSDSGVTVDGAEASTDASAAVYTGASIVYYEEGRDETYGEGTEEEGHSAEEAAAHTVVTITQPGAYRVSGTLSAGQLAVDLGEDAAENPEAVVTLILDGADISCSTAPAVIFYNVYECGTADTETASPTVDTTAAGANVVIADGSVNNITGSHVAKIYKEGTDKKLHKYDGGFYSKMSMNVTGESQGTGTLNITADNEGLDAELHLTINGGKINITAQNDGINTNEDGVSVTTINGGILTIRAGLGAEGDGIDSNGYLVVNGGTITTSANPKSGDGGIDSDGGIYLNGGTVVALGGRNDGASTDSGQPYMELSFSAIQTSGAVVTMQNSSGKDILNFTADRDFQTLTFSSPDLKEGETYAVYVNGVQQQYTGNSFGMGGGMGGPGGGMNGQKPEDLPEGAEPPSDATRPERPSFSEDGAAPSETAPVTEGQTPPDGGFQGGNRQPPDGTVAPGAATASAEASPAFTISDTSHSFSRVEAVSSSSSD